MTPRSLPRQDANDGEAPRGHALYEIGSTGFVADRATRHRPDDLTGDASDGPITLKGDMTMAKKAAKKAAKKTAKKK